MRTPPSACSDCSSPPTWRSAETRRRWKAPSSALLAVPHPLLVFLRPPWAELPRLLALLGGQHGFHLLAHFEARSEYLAAQIIDLLLLVEQRLRLHAFGAVHPAQFKGLRAHLAHLVPALATVVFLDGEELLLLFVAQVEGSERPAGAWAVTSAAHHAGAAAHHARA